MWGASLRVIKKRISRLFTQDRVATNAGQFLESLLGDEQREIDWMHAAAANAGHGGSRQRLSPGANQMGAAAQLVSLWRDNRNESASHLDRRRPCHLELPDLDAEQFNDASDSGWC